MNQNLCAGIISAGHGLRFKSRYPESIKPMILIKGSPLISWTVSSLRQAGIRRITVLFNSQGGPARKYLESHFNDIEWTFVIKDTRSSWESFQTVCRRLAQTPDPFLVSTVDVLARPQEIARFMQTAFRAFKTTATAGKSDAAIEMALALTPFVEDEKPLWADLSQKGFVTAMGPDAIERKLVTCGLYALAPKAAASMPSPAAFDSLREFWINAVRQGYRIPGVPLSRTIDVDRPEDLTAAEGFLGAPSQTSAPSETPSEDGCPRRTLSGARIAVPDAVPGACA